MATASASAAPMIIVDRISPAASGLRPSASIAPRTALPIPMPGPMPPRPIASAAPIAFAASTKSVPVTALILLMLVVVRVFVLIMTGRGQRDVNGSQEREDKCLNRSKQHFEEQKYDRQRD